MKAVCVKWISLLNLVLLLKSILASFILISVCGCNMVSDEAPSSDVMRGDTLPQLCKIDPDSIKNITNYDISPDLNCLGDNFNQFINSVESDRRGYLYKQDLKKFIERYFQGDAENLKKGIESLFQINYLLVGQEENYISQRQLNNLVRLLVTFNRAIVKVYKYYEDKTERSDSLQAMHRYEIETVMQDFTLVVQQIIRERGDTPASLELMSVLRNFISDDVTLDKIKGLLFAKKIFFGGNKYMITNTDIKKVIDNLPTITGIIYDLLQVANVNFYDPNGSYEFLDKNVKDIQKLMFYAPNSNEILFTLDELAKASKPFAETFIDLTKYPNTLLEVKKLLVDTPNAANIYDKHITAANLTTIFNHALKVLDEGIYFAKFSDYYEDLIYLPVKITHPMDDYPVNSELEKQYLDHYRQVAQNYRFYKGSFEAPYYANHFYRNPKGINEVAMLEYVLKLLMKFHGAETNGAYSLTVNQLLDVIKRFRDLLLDKEIIIPGREVASSENALLLSNLFQYQSNGNSTLDLPEATEFAYTLFSGIGIGDYIKAELKLYCKNGQNNRIEIECFQRYFFQVLRGKYGNSFPKLFQFVDENSDNSTAVNALIETTARFARVCPDNPTFSDNDMVAVLGGLLNVESTLIRFDHNQDNILDYEELMDAFQVYKGSIETLIAKMDNTGMLKKLSKEIFLFLVKYETTPDPKNAKSLGKFLKFLLENKKKITGDRRTIASILKNLGVIAKKDREAREIYDPPGLCKLD